MGVPFDRPDEVQDCRGGDALRFRGAALERGYACHDLEPIPFFPIEQDESWYVCRAIRITRIMTQARFSANTFIMERREAA
jgi:hypothetical protein